MFARRKDRSLLARRNRATSFRAEAGRLSDTTSDLLVAAIEKIDPENKAARSPSNPFSLGCPRGIGSILAPLTLGCCFHDGWRRLMWHIQGDSTREIPYLMENVSSFANVWYALLMTSAIQFATEVIPPAFKFVGAGAQAYTVFGDDNYVFNTSDFDLSVFCQNGWACLPITTTQRVLWVLSKALWILAVPSCMFGLLIHLILGAFRSVPVQKRRQYLHDNAMLVSAPWHLGLVTFTIVLFAVPLRIIAVSLLSPWSSDFEVAAVLVSFGGFFGLAAYGFLISAKLLETFFRPWEEAYKVVNSAASDAAVRPASDAAVHPASDAAVRPASDAAVRPASDAAVHPADLVIELSESDSERLEKLANAVSILSAMKVPPAMQGKHDERVDQAVRAVDDVMAKLMKASKLPSSGLLKNKNRSLFSST